MLSYTSAVIIALDATPLTVSTGGVARYTSELARALAVRYPESHFWLVSDQPFEVAAEIPANLQCGQPPRTAMARKWWLWGLQQELMKIEADVFHGTDFSVPYLPFRPAVMTIHDLSPWLDASWQPEAGRIRRRTPRLLRAGFATRIITPSETVRRAAIERFGLDPERVIAVPHAASEHFRPVACAAASTPYFVFVGTLEPRKNLGRLVEAWREVRKTRAVDLVLAGRVRRDFAAFPGEPGLHQPGPVPEEKLAELYSGALAVVYPSLYEGFGLPVLEAMQCGALVVTSRDPAILEVTGGEAAVHVDAMDTRRLGGVLAAIFDAPTDFAPVRERAIVRAREFSWQRTAERTWEVYDAARRAFRK